MEFNNQYLTFKEYGNLKGNLLEMPFNLLEFKSRMAIDRKTFGRIKKLTIIPDEVKLCINELIGFYDSLGNIAFSSESVGSYSASKKELKEIEKAENSIIKNYLSELELNGIPLLYPGADV